MREIREKMLARVKELIADGTADRVVGWKTGEFVYDVTPAVFGADDTFEEFVFNGFCGANQSKFLVNAPKGEKKMLVLLKPCDTYSYNQLIKEHRINPEQIYALGIPCTGMFDINKVRALGITGITGFEENGEEVIFHTLYGDEKAARKDILLERCLVCKGKQHVCGDELLIPDEEAPDVPNGGDRMELVEKLEKMSEQERFDFWRSELSKCIRCNACRNACPACTCRNCVFDNPASGVDSKANTDTFEENMFHIIRAYHVAGRCTDCGECSRVCPQNIPLHLLNRKFIKDINELYGEYQAGADSTEPRGPLTSYTQDDAEPSIVLERGV